MADKDTLNLIKFKFGSFQSIKDLSSKDQSSFYFASDKPTFYNAGVWYGVSSLTSSVNEETGEVTLVINGGFGDNWKSSQEEHTFVAGMTKQQKADLKKAVSFVNSVTSTEGEDTQTIIDKWNEIVKFLAGFKDTDVLLDRISTIENEVDDLKETTIAAGDGLTGGGNLSANRTIGLGKPSTITDSSTNSVTAESHTHAIDEASTEQRGIVRLNNSLESDSTDQALTAKQGKVLKEHIDDMFTLVDKGDGTKYIQSKYGFASDSFISARGVDEESAGVGGLDAQAVWDLLMQNDDATKVINIAHIPDITIAKITDIANASVANAVNAEKVGGYTAANFTRAINFNQGEVIPRNIHSVGYIVGTGVDGETPKGDGGGYLASVRHDGYGGHLFIANSGSVFSRGVKSSAVTSWKELAFTDSNVASATNADKLDGLHAKDFVKYFVGTSVEEVQSSSLGYGQTEFGSKVNGLLLTGLYLDGKYGGQINGNVAGTELYYRGKTGSGWTTWKQLAFTDSNITGNAASASALYRPSRLDNVDYTADKIGSFTHLLINSVIGDNFPFPLGSSSILHMEWDSLHSYSRQLAVGGDRGIDEPNNRLKWRAQNKGVWCDWKTVAFADTNSLTPSGGTLNINGNLTVANQLTIGNATLYWDVANQCLRVNSGIASDSFLSAKGIDTTGNGQGGGGGFDATMLWNELTIPSPTNSGKTIMLDLLPDIPTSKVTDFANQVKALITVENIPTLTSAKISDFNTAVATAMSSTLSDISANLSNHEQRLQAIEKALTWQGI